MKPLASESIELFGFPVGFGISICFISDDRISDRCEVYPDLVCSSCEEIYLNERVFICYISFIAKVCFSNFWVYRVVGRHTFSIIRISPDERLYISLLLYDFPKYKCEIGFVYCSFCHLQLEGVHGFVILGDDDESTCVFVESVDDARLFYTVDN